ncbi:MAG: S8 family serine peptidase [Phycisphaerae bacterium]|nr:S8 family serine peptidase [Phycisphaerae bacterium]
MTVVTLTLATGASYGAVPPRPALGPVPPDHTPGHYAERPGVVEFSGQLIVRPRQDLSVREREAALARLDGRVLKIYTEVDEFVLRAESGRAGSGRGAGENELSAALMATGLFQYAVPNWICFPLNTPDDPLYPSQWHHPVMRSPQAWDLSTGSSSVIVAVTDTGIDLTHPELAPKRVPGFDAYHDIAEVDGGSVADLHGHGTHVSGCAAAIANNGIGIVGVNWGARIMMIRVAIDASGGAYYDDLLQGARWAIEHGAKTVSASYSGIDYEPIQTTGAYIKSIGGLYFYAAGNDQRNLSWFDWADVTVVGASTYGDAPAWFTASGNAVDMFAPGVDILSSCVGGISCYSSGTSMATPIANGVASMIWSVNPGLTPQQVQDMLYASCVDLGNPGDDSYWGWGRADTLNAVTAALATLCPGDYNGDTSVDDFDFFEYLNDFNANDLRADFNGDTSVDDFDYFEFLNAFFTPC